MVKIRTIAITQNPNMIWRNFNLKHIKSVTESCRISIGTFQVARSESGTVMETLLFIKSLGSSLRAFPNLVCCSAIAFAAPS